MSKITGYMWIHDNRKKVVIKKTKSNAQIEYKIKQPIKAQEQPLPQESKLIVFRSVWITDVRSKDGQ